jgi:carotenoid 1,2-hydratase
LSPALGFDQPILANGYRWWYVDALSTDRRHGLTIIAFVGSVFSPYYKWARRRGPAEPLNHAAVNVALYGEARHKWAMTERGRGAVARDAASFAVGPSHLAWDGTALVLSLDEVTFPLPGRIRGHVRLEPTSLNALPFTLAASEAGADLHQWRPIAPTAAVEVVLEKPALRWRGHGYLDSNWGGVPLEDSFVRWDWSRAPAAGGAAVLYEGRRRDGTDFGLALHFDRTGRAAAFLPPPRHELGRTAIWRIPRATRAEAPGGAALAATLEDTPFYARSVLRTRLLGEATTAVHESLELDRFALPIVQAMLPFRMPRQFNRLTG